MNYVITGSIGNISRPLVQKLVSAGHSVKVISSNESRRKEIESLGAVPLTGSVEDVQFLKKSFAGADAVYTMVPPNFGVSDWKSWIGGIGALYAEAIKQTGVNYEFPTRVSFIRDRFFQFVWSAAGRGK